MPIFADLDQIAKTKPNDYKLINYNPMDSIPAPMAV
jgi:thymidylate synthase